MFGEVCPVVPDDDMVTGPWLYGPIDNRQRLPGWSGLRPSTGQDCEAVLERATKAVTDHLGTAPERTTLSSEAVAAGPR